MPVKHFLHFATMNVNSEVVEVMQIKLNTKKINQVKLRA